MIQALKRAVEAIEKLSEARQDEIADELLAEIEDEKWQGSFARDLE